MASNRQLAQEIDFDLRQFKQSNEVDFSSPLPGAPNGERTARFVFLKTIISLYFALIFSFHFYI